MGDLSAEEITFLKEQVEEHTLDIVWWPRYYRELMLSSHLKYLGRFQLTMFLLGNRLNPETIVQWFIGHGMLKDQAARVHVSGIIKAHKLGELENKTTFVMHATTRDGDSAVQSGPHFMFQHGSVIAQGDVQPLVTPSFACYEEDNAWDNAMKMLRNNTSRRPSFG